MVDAMNRWRENVCLCYFLSTHGPAGLVFDLWLPERMFMYVYKETCKRCLRNIPQKQIRSNLNIYGDKIHEKLQTRNYPHAYQQQTG